MADEDAAAEEAPPEEAPVEEAPVEEAPVDEPPPPPSASHQDSLSMEFLYYGSLLKAIAGTLSCGQERKLLTPWIKKLFRPEYQTSKLRDKRNRYLVALCINILNDEVHGCFRERPPKGNLAELHTFKYELSPAAEWELDKMWQETLLALPDDFEMMACPIHETPEECAEDHKPDKVLDQEFQFLLYITRPYAALLPAEDKLRTASWIQLLCTIHGEACASLKGMRNDYMMALMGYLHDLRIVGPFVDYPPEQLIPLSEAAKNAAKTIPVTDPTGPDANQFLAEQPIPEDGAFCYIALTGDLVASSF